MTLHTTDMISGTEVVGICNHAATIKHLTQHLVQPQGLREYVHFERDSYARIQMRFVQYENAPWQHGAHHYVYSMILHVTQCNHQQQTWPAPASKKGKPLLFEQHLYCQLQQKLLYKMLHHRQFRPITLF